MAVNLRMTINMPKQQSSICHCFNGVLTSSIARYLVPIFMVLGAAIAQESPVMAQAATNIINSSFAEKTGKSHQDGIRFTTRAYEREALNLLLREANDVAAQLKLGENLPIVEPNIIPFISTYGMSQMQSKTVGNVATTNYVYYVSVDHKFSYLEVAHQRDVWQRLRDSYRWPKELLNTNEAYQMATQWLTDISMDVAALNRDCKVHVEPDVFVNSGNEGSWPFAAGEITHLQNFANKLAQHTDPVSIFIWKEFTSEARKMLVNYQPSTANSNDVELVLVDNLNRIINKGPVYEKDRFRNVRLREEMKTLLEKNYEGPALAHLNRWLLEDAYPELARHSKNRKTSFVPVYSVSWVSTAAGSSTKASVRLLAPTRTLLSLRVEESKYILRKPLQFTNLQELLSSP